MRQKKTKHITTCSSAKVLCDPMLKQTKRQDQSNPI
jgi:hypothetical protein